MSDNMLVDGYMDGYLGKEAGRLDAALGLGKRMLSMGKAGLNKATQFFGKGLEETPEAARLADPRRIQALKNVGNKAYQATPEAEQVAKMGPMDWFMGRNKAALAGLDKTLASTASKMAPGAGPRGTTIADPLGKGAARIQATKDALPWMKENLKTWGTRGAAAGAVATPVAGAYALGKANAPAASAASPFNVNLAPNHPLYPVWDYIRKNPGTSMGIAALLALLMGGMGSRMFGGR